MGLDKSRLRTMHKDLVKCALELDRIGWTATYNTAGIRFRPPAISKHQMIMMSAKKTVNVSTLSVIQRKTSSAVHEYEELMKAIEEPAIPVEQYVEITLGNLSPADQILVTKGANNLDHDMLDAVASASPIGEGRLEAVATGLKRQRDTSKKLTVVSRKPLLARKASKRDGGTRYESKAVVELTMSDGSTIYECAFPTCDFRNESYRSVSAHYGGAHGDKLPATQDGPTYVDPTYTEPLSHREGYQPSSRLVNALSEELRKALAAGFGREKIAEQMLIWFHDRPDLGSLEERTRPHGDLTTEQILERVRLLVDSGRTMRLEEENRRLQAQIDAANHAIERQREARKVIAEMLIEEDSE